MTTVLERQINRMRLPSRERDVVSELTEVMHRYADQSPARLAHLLQIAFGVAVEGDSREAKLGRALTRGLEARQQLAGTEGGSLSAEDAARLLQISKTAVLKRLEAGRLLAWQEERLKARRFPRWQFDEHGQVLKGFEEMLAILNQDDRLDAWGKVLFFLQEKPSLDGRRPLDLLREGKLKEAQRAAKAYAE